MIKLRKFFNLITREVFPKGYKCVCCSEELNKNSLYFVCDKCMEKLPFNNDKTCHRCSEPLNNLSNYCIHCKNEVPHFKKNVSVFLYKHPIDDLIRKLKYDNHRYLSDTLSNFLVSEVVKMGVNFDLVVPVPLYKKREKLRGFNQSLLLCKSFKEKLNLNVEKGVLIKIRETKNQANMSRSEREENLHDAFSVADKSKVKGKVVLIVDDVFTTGTTINECAKTLIEAGAKEVYSVTLAHADTTKYFVKDKI